MLLATVGRTSLTVETTSTMSHDRDQDHHQTADTINKLNDEVLHMVKLDKRGSQNMEDILMPPQRQL